MIVEKLIIDYSMAGLEGGVARVYREVAPTITARLYKDPWIILEREEIGSDERADKND